MKPTPIKGSQRTSVPVGKTGASSESQAPRRKLPYMLLAPLSAPLAILALPGFELWPLAFVAWIPLLIALMRLPLAWGVLAALITGYLYFLGSIYWLTWVTTLGWVAVCLYFGLYFVLFAALCRWSTTGHPRVPFILAAPVTWVAVEFLRSATWTGPDLFLFTGFPWELAGHPLYRQTTFIQVADFAGAYGVSFAVVTVNAFLAGLAVWLLEPGPVSRWGKVQRVAAGAYVVVLIVGVIVYGNYRMREYAPVEGPRVVVIQGNIGQELKEVARQSRMGSRELWAEAARTRKEMIDTYMELTREASGCPRDILVWPETVMPGPIETQVDAHEAVEELCALSDSYVLVGTTRDSEDPTSDLHYNSVYFYSRENDHPLGIYDKVHPVPFGEYIPMVKWFPWLERFMPPGYLADVAAGREAKLFRIPREDGGEWKFATPICFEDTMPYLIRQFKGLGADFVINVTNDGWFGKTRELDQHMAVSVFRAVENRLGLVRAANTGISAFIEPSGRVGGILTDKKGRFRQVRGFLCGRVMVDPRKSPYSLHGEAFATVCLGWTVVFLILRGVRVFLFSEGKK